MEKNIEIVTRSTGIFADQTLFVRLNERTELSFASTGVRSADFVNGQLNIGAFVVKFSSNVNVGRSRSHGETGDQTAFDQFLRVVSHDFSVFARSRLAFVGVDDQILRPAVRRFIHETPFQAGGKTGATATSQPTLLHFIDDPRRTFENDFFRFVPIALRHAKISMNENFPSRRSTNSSLRALQMPIVSTVEVREDPIFVLQRTEFRLKGRKNVFSKNRFFFSIDELFVEAEAEAERPVASISIES